MRAAVAAVALALAMLVAGGAARAAPQWAAATPSPVGRLEGAVAVVGSRLYAFGGFGAGLGAQTASHVYDPGLDRWDPIEPMPHAVTHAQAAVVGSFVYIAGGFEGANPGTAIDVVQRYDTLGNAWSTTAIPALPEPRASGGFVGLGTELHYLGGLLGDRCTDTTTHLVFDTAQPGLGWQARAPMNETRNHFQAVVEGGRIYVAGGQRGHDCGIAELTGAEVYEPAANAWRVIAPLPAARSHHEPSAFAWNGRIVIGGGTQNGASSLAYDIARDRWTAWPDLPAARRSPYFQRIGDRLLFGTGGSDSGVTARADFYVNAVRSDAPRVLFVRGADRSGGFLEATDDVSRTENLGDVDEFSTATGNHGWGSLRGTLESEGYHVAQIAETAENTSGPSNGLPVPLATLPVGDYAAIVLGSNNASYGATAVDALFAFVTAGGGALFVSDANFGSSWSDAPASDQAFLARFGLTMNQDFGIYGAERANGDFVAPAHPILAGIDVFDGEGVSPITISGAVPGVSALVVARAEGEVRIDTGTGLPGPTRPVTAADGALVVATAGAGRVAGHFDRNTFFNVNGAGTSIARLDNRAYAINLFAWLAQGAVDPPLFRDGYE